MTIGWMDHPENGHFHGEYMGIYRNMRLNHWMIWCTLISEPTVKHAWKSHGCRYYVLRCITKVRVELGSKWLPDFMLSNMARTGSWVQWEIFRIQYMEVRKCTIFLAIWIVGIFPETKAFFYRPYIWNRYLQFLSVPAIEWNHHGEGVALPAEKRWPHTHGIMVLKS